MNLGTKLPPKDAKIASNMQSVDAQPVFLRVVIRMLKAQVPPRSFTVSALL
jgi:hypothetical protein